MNANWYTYSLVNARGELVAQDQYQSKATALAVARSYAAELHAVTIDVQSPTGRLVVREHLPTSGLTS